MGCVIMILWILSNSWPRQHLCSMARRRSFFELLGCRKFRTFCSACCRNTHKNMSSCWQDAYYTAVLPYNHKDHKRVCQNTQYKNIKLVVCPFMNAQRVFHFSVNLTFKSLVGNKYCVYRHK